MIDFKKESWFTRYMDRYKPDVCDGSDIMYATGFLGAAKTEEEEEKRDAEEARRLRFIVSGIRFKGILSPIRIWTESPVMWLRGDRTHRVVLELAVPHRDTGVAVTIQISETFTTKQMVAMDEVAIVKAIEAKVLELIAHEARESFYYDGKLFDDPHAK